MVPSHCRPKGSASGVTLFDGTLRCMRPKAFTCAVVCYVKEAGAFGERGQLNAARGPSALHVAEFGRKCLEELDKAARAIQEDGVIPYVVNNCPRFAFYQARQDAALLDLAWS